MRVVRIKFSWWVRTMGQFVQATSGRNLSSPTYNSQYRVFSTILTKYSDYKQNFGTYGLSPGMCVCACGSKDRLRTDFRGSVGTARLRIPIGECILANKDPSIPTTRLRDQESPQIPNMQTKKHWLPAIARSWSKRII